MGQLEESDLLAPISEHQRRFAEQGYLYFRSFFSAREISAVRERIEALLCSEGWGTKEERGVRASMPVRRIGSPPFFRLLALIMAEELVHECGEGAALAAFLSRLLGEPVFCHPRKMVRIGYPYSLNPKDRVPPHQDLFYVKGELDTFTAWIPLGEYPEERGGLLVAPETHKQGLFPTQSNEEGRFGCAAVCESVQKRAFLHSHYRPGDLLLMHSLTLHQAGLNRTELFRISLDCRFSSKEKSVNEEQLLPPYYPHLPDWHKLRSNWPKKRALCIPSTVQLQPKEKELREILSQETRFAGP